MVLAVSAIRLVREILGDGQFLLFGLGTVLVVDLQGLLLYNIKQQGMPYGFPQEILSEMLHRKIP